MKTRAGLAWTAAATSVVLIVLAVVATAVVVSDSPDLTMAVEPRQVTTVTRQQAVDEPPNYRVPAVGEICAENRRFDNGTACWSSPNLAGVDVLKVTVEARALDASDRDAAVFHFTTADGSRSPSVALKDRELHKVVIEPGSTLVLTKGRLTVLTAPRGDGWPTTGDVCRESIPGVGPSPVTTCWWTAPQDRIMSVAVVGGDAMTSSGPGASFYIRNHDGLQGPRVHVGHNEHRAVSLRAQDFLYLEQGELSIASSTPERLIIMRSTDPDWPTVPRYADVCSNPISPSQRPCWWVPPGHHPVAVTLWARGNGPSDYNLQVIIKNVDGTTSSSFNLAYGDTRTVTLRGGDNVKLPGKLWGNSLIVTGVRDLPSRPPR